MIRVNPLIEKVFTSEPMFEIFKHEGLLCCIQRMNHSGVLNGYVAVHAEHPLYGKDYNFEIDVDEEPQFNGNYFGLFAHAFKEDRKEKLYPLSMAINVHGGLTYTSDGLGGIDDNIFGELWWFGFDTAHAGDLKPFQNEIDMKYNLHDGDNVYRDFEFVKEQTKSLAEQLAKLSCNVPPDKK